MMARLNIVVEGATEERFVNDILRVPLANQQIFVNVRRIQTSQKGGQRFRGGMLKFEHAFRDLQAWMKEDRKADAYFSTMFDLYGLRADFPGYARARPKRDPYKKVEVLEEALAAEINHGRFIPYIQLHEVEALLLCEPRRFSIHFPEDSSAIGQLVGDLRKFASGSPELIDDGQNTAPSKRIIRRLPQYEKQKVIASAAVSAHIGLDVMRKKCPHFDAWLKRIESIPWPSPPRRTSS